MQCADSMSSNRWSVECVCVVAVGLGFRPEKHTRICGKCLYFTHFPRFALRRMFVKEASPFVRLLSSVSHTHAGFRFGLTVPFACLVGAYRAMKIAERHARWWWFGRRQWVFLLLHARQFFHMVVPAQVQELLAVVTRNQSPGKTLHESSSGFPTTHRELGRKFQ